MKAKIVFASLAGCLLFFSSCKKADTSSIDSTVSGASGAKQSELAIAAASSDSTDSTFNHHDCKFTPVPINTLPKSVAAYINSSFPGASVEMAGSMTDGKCIVGIKKTDGSHVGLLFDASGTFIKEKPLPPNPKPGVPVNVSNLPSSISEYINTNYPGATMERACKMEDNNYIVGIKKSDGSHVGLAFSEEGQFLTELPAPPQHGPGDHSCHHKPRKKRNN